MTKKVTGKQLKDLLEGVLNEKTYRASFSDNPYEDIEGDFEKPKDFGAKFTPSLSGTKVDLIRGLDSPDLTMDLKDVEVLVKYIKNYESTGDNQRRAKNAEKALNALKNSLSDRPDSLSAVQSVIDRYKVTADKSANVNNEDTPLKDLKFLARGNDVDLPYFLKNVGDVKPENKQPLNSAAAKKNFFAELSKDAEINNEFITGDDLLKVVADAAKFGQFHVDLVGLIRLSYDLYLQASPDKSGIPPMLIALEAAVRQVSTASEQGDVSQGKGAPIPQFAITSHMAEEGFSQKTSSLVVAIFRSTFSANSVTGKIEAMEQFARKFNEGELKNEDTGEQLKGTIILDFFRRLVQDYDASSAGFLFESFLAMLLDGTKMGGNQRLEDFIIGSAPGAGITSADPVTLKLYQAGTSETTSALATYERFFSQNPNGTITSISGIKMDGDIGVTLYEKKITQADFNYLISDKPKNARVNKVPGKGLRYILPKSGAPKVGVSIGSSTKLGDIYFGFLSVEEDKFFDQAQQAFTGAAEQIGQMFEFYNNFKFSSTEYLSGLDPNKAGDAVEDFLQMKKMAAQVFVKDDGGKIAGKSGQTIDEQKITADFLKNLISESFKR